MSGILNTGLEFWQILVGLAAVVFSVIVIKVVIAGGGGARYRESRKRKYIA